MFEYLFIKGNIIHRGNFSSVYHCTLNGESSVYKVGNGHGKNTILNEISILKKFDNKYIVKPLVLSYDQPSFITEYRGEDLFNFITSNIIDKNEKIKILEQIIESVLHIHSKKVCHLDLKLENIVYNGDHITIIDFGLSHIYIDDNYKILKKHCGTKHYVAPEVYNREVYDGFIADMWSFGIIIFVMFLGFFPYHNPVYEDPAFSILINENTESLCKFYKKKIDTENVPLFILKIMDKVFKKEKKRYNIFQTKYLLNYYLDTKNRHIRIVV